jgi:hypothetical protein
MEDIGIFYGHWVYFTAIRYLLWTLVVFCGNLIYFSPCWYIEPRKIWQPRPWWLSKLSGDCNFNKKVQSTLWRFFTTIGFCYDKDIFFNGWSRAMCNFYPNLKWKRGFAATDETDELASKCFKRKALIVTFSRNLYNKFIINLHWKLTYLIWHKTIFSKICQEWRRSLSYRYYILDFQTLSNLVWLRDSLEIYETVK